MDVETYVTFVLKKYIFYIFLTFSWHFFTLHSTQTIKVIGLINQAMIMNFNPFTYSLRPFMGGGRYAPPGYMYIDSDPPAFKGLINHESETSISLKVRNKKIASAKIKMQHFFRNLKKIVKPDFLSSMKQAYS